MTALGDMARSVFGSGESVYVYKIGLGNEFRRIPVRTVTDSFLKFKDRGTNYIILKTVPPYIDPKGTRHYFVWETDVHTADPDTGEVLDAKLEGEYKKRLMANELEDFKDILDEVKAEALRERAEELFAGMELTQTHTGESTIKSKEEDGDILQIDITIPSLKLGKTRRLEISELTPHDTINEVLSMILDGTILKSLIKPKKMDWQTITGILIVGICLGWIFVIAYMVLAPAGWAAFVGGG